MKISSVEEALADFKKPLLLEKKLDYRDRAVTKGLSSYLKIWQEESLKGLSPRDYHNIIKPIVDILNDYSEVSKADRIKKCQKVFKLIETFKKVSFSHINYFGIESPVQYVKKVGPERAKLFKKLRVNSVKDLLYYFPRRYEDRSQMKTISTLNLGEIQTIRGQILALEVKKVRRNLSILKMAVGDGTGIIYATWFNQPYLKNIMPIGTKIIISGKVERFGILQMANPAYEILSGSEEDLLHVGRIVPIYPATEKLNQRIIRQVMKNALDEFLPFLVDPLPDYLLKEYEFRNLRDTIREIHFPSDSAGQNEARRRLVFEEFFYLQLVLAINKGGRKESSGGIKQGGGGQLVKKFLESLPFELTGDQKKAVEEIRKDMDSHKIMNRLLQGEVGAGKTVVAIIALLVTIENGYQGVIMVPTEILAEQHYLTLQKFLIPLEIQVDFLIGNMPKKAKNKVLKEVKDGDVQIVIGTHALLEEGVHFQKLGLVVIDEQHRFGVLQRAALKAKGLNPDILIMTATPIPRTLSLTVYGDLDISTIGSLPAGRKPITTYWLNSKQRSGVYKFIKEEVSAGHQAYVVYPLIKRSEKLDLKAAEDGAALLQNEVFPDLKIALLHGRVKRDEKEKIMRNFRDKKIDILVSTTVIEVGIDISNVTVMVIEEAQRFGLAQLHQLRGRIGRGEFPSYCILFSDSSDELSRRRLQVMTETTDGFKIAEEDLGMRGPGEFLGTRQHGLPEFRIGNIVSDLKILEQARETAFKLIKEDPALSFPEHQLLGKSLREKFKNKLKLISVS